MSWRIFPAILRGKGVGVHITPRLLGDLWTPQMLVCSAVTRAWLCLQGVS